jgi:hypothetical protein
MLILPAATGMCGRIMFGGSFHPLNCTLLEVKCRAARLPALERIAAKTTI